MLFKATFVLRCDKSLVVFVLSMLSAGYDFVQHVCLYIISENVTSRNVYMRIYPVLVCKCHLFQV